MSEAEVFAACAEQRRDIADFLETLDDSQLAAQSLCGEWDVRTVGAHLTVLISVPRSRLALAAVRARGSFDRANAAVAKQVATQPVPRVAQTLRDRATSRATPPVGGHRAPLTDVLIHGGDMRIPLGLPFEPPVPLVETALDFLTGRAIGFVPSGRLRGLALAPTDSAWRWGSGEPVTGRAADLMMAVCGRPAVLDRLGGRGVELLAARIA
jgi:uncharacterized protein (TIGR03083 family)